MEEVEKQEVEEEEEEEMPARRDLLPQDFLQTPIPVIPQLPPSTVL